MRLDVARRALVDALAPTQRETAAGAGVHTTARLVLLQHGTAALGLALTASLSLPELIRIAAAAPRSEARRDFAVLLVDALGIPGVIASRPVLDRDLCSFLESALLNPLRRAGYDFAAPIYEKRRALNALHATLDEHLRPLDLTFPAWLRGSEPWHGE